jgi:hypothetical protein
MFISHSVTRSYISTRHLEEVKMTRLFLTGLFAVLLLGFPGGGQQAGSAELRMVQYTSEQSDEEDTAVSDGCVRFDPQDVHVVVNPEGYGLASAGTWITDVTGSRAEARLAVYIIRFYGMDEFCTVGEGGKALSYYLVNGWAPQGRSPSEDCLWFDQTGSQLRELDGRWTLVDRNETALSLGRDKAAAVKAVKTIRARNFSEICFVGRPGPSMVYFIR